MWRWANEFPPDAADDDRQTRRIVVGGEVHRLAHQVPLISYQVNIDLPFRLT
jgi:hypothetical protein